MKILLVSDTHNSFPCTYQRFDVVAHCGDATNYGTLKEFMVFSDWWNSIDAEHKLFVPGNHEIGFYKNYPQSLKWLPSDVKVLIDEEIVINGMKFYGSPWIPEINGMWAYEASEQKREEKFNAIPTDTDVLLTHSPPYMVLDKTRSGETIGCAYLLRHSGCRAKPNIHAFGHVHECGGREIKFDGEDLPTTYMNVARHPKIVEFGV